MESEEEPNRVMSPIRIRSHVLKASVWSLHPLFCQCPRTDRAGVLSVPMDLQSEWEPEREDTCRAVCLMSSWS